MQKKSLLYVFGITSFFGLVLGAGFFANELRVKIIQGPDTDQFTAKSQAVAVSPVLNSAKTNTAISAAPTPLPSPAKPPQTETTVPETPPANDPVSTTQDEKDDSFSFAVFGDTQKFDPGISGGGLQQAVKNITSKNPELVMAEGDLVGNCDGGSKCEAKLVDWKNTLGALFSKTYEIMGEHDRSGKDKSDALWQKFFELPQNGPEGYQELAYSFDVKNSHFVVLDSERSSEHSIDKIQRDWLEKNLADNKKDNIFVFFHEPAYPVSGEIGSSLDANKDERDALWKILKEHKVAAVFNGHEHIVSRKKINDVYQYVFGNTDSADQELPKEGMADYSYQGKSYGIVEVKGKEVIVNAYSADGNLLDSFNVPR